MYERTIINVEILSITPNPLDVISLAAGCCYGKHDVHHKRVHRCMINNHMSVLEHASITVRITGVSRNCTHQLVRHRLCSFAQQSQRYCKLGDGEDWYVTPPSVLADPEKNQQYQDLMRMSLQLYHTMVSDGVAAEDARFDLPSAAQTEIVVTANARQWMTMFGLRLDKHAQWEIRDLFQMIYDQMFQENDQWAQLLTWMREVHFGSASPVVTDMDK